MEKSWNLTSGYCMSTNRRRYAAKNSTNRFCAHSVRSWNFVVWSWKSHGKVMEFCHGNFVATLTILAFTTIALNELLLLHFCSHTKRGEFHGSNTLFYLMEVHQFLQKLFQISFGCLNIKPDYLLELLER